MKPLLECKRISRLISEAQDHPLAAQDRVRLRLHLVICKACRNIDDQFRVLREAVNRLGGAEPPQG